MSDSKDLIIERLYNEVDKNYDTTVQLAGVVHGQEVTLSKHDAQIRIWGWFTKILLLAIVTLMFSFFTDYGKTTIGKHIKPKPVVHSQGTQVTTKSPSN